MCKRVIKRAPPTCGRTLDSGGIDEFLQLLLGSSYPVGRIFLIREVLGEEILDAT